MLSLTHTDRAIERFLSSQTSGLKVLAGGRNNRVLQANHPRLGYVVIKDYFQEIRDYYQERLLSRNKRLFLRNKRLLSRKTIIKK